MTKKYKIISLFSGAGGLDLGFYNNNFEIIWANDFDKVSVETYKKNLGNHIIYGDITKINSSSIPNNADVILGGFPCQGFSVANNKRNMKDMRNYLYLEMVRIINDKQPKIFVAENVKGLLSMENGKILEMIIKDFKDIGYEVDYKVLNSADYGVPQLRERIVIVGNKIGKKNLFPKKTHDNFNLKDYQKQITVKESIGFLKDIEVSENPIKINNMIIKNHIASENVLSKFWKRKYNITQREICDYLNKWKKNTGISIKTIDKIFGYKHTAGHWFRKDNNSGSIPKPHDWWKLKELLKFDNKYDKQVTEFIEKDITFEQSLRIVNWDKPSDTITASQPEIHINKKRRLSIRECAILQSFPLNFEFNGSKSGMYRQIGNAVPPLLAEKIAKCVIEMLET
ncbi:DNA cytosine methyltransferase [Spiroplasma endosymbiont of Amphimallon solstitiale]|uniref:DNA cytosine methyltransferase n=1 Tax=Spiroplasma endosymbiont of Amphimallon solstitiale TaxID=3066288 RepID=UPI00313CC6EC